MAFSEGLSRRAVLAGTAVSAAVAVSGGSAVVAAGAAFGGTPGRLRGEPFTLGVASGDPDERSVVLWTRLAPQPLAADGRGGMPDRPVTVSWVVAHDAALRRVVRRGTAPAVPAYAHSVHVEVGGLAPGREYYYRFTAQGYASAVGRTRTAPPAGSLPAALRLAVASCAQYEHGYFTAYRALARQHPDLVLHLGDYLYEYAPGTHLPPYGGVRGHAGPETAGLADYRRRHAQYRTDPDLQAAHAVAPWLVVFDDHEVANNWAGDRPDPAFRRRRAAALRAYWEHMPLRRASLPVGPHLQLYRRLRWGQLANLHLLDTRQYRSAQVCGPGFRVCPGAAAPRRTLTGAAQERWLRDGLHRSAARWDLLGQQVFFGQRDRDPGEAVVTRMDAWDGYLASRAAILGAFDAVRNPVVLTGDVHAHWAGQLTHDFRDPAARPVGAELVCSSVTSGGDGRDAAPSADRLFRGNPQLRFHNDQRGYLLATLTPTTLTADFQVVPYVTRRGAPAYSRARYTLADGDATLHPEHLRRVDPPAPVPRRVVSEKHRAT